MNFTEDMDDSLPVGKKEFPHKAAENQQTEHESELDKDAMDSAQKAGERMHHNEETNSSNTMFSK